MSNTNVGGVEWVVDADTKGATNSLKSMGAQVDKAENKLKELDAQATKTAKGVKKGMAGMSRGAGQAGIQVQQFIGQVQGGQGVMLAFSQQAADIGIVLGAPMMGAVLGISASIVGMMLPALLGGKTGMELMEKATENVKAALTLSTEGIVEYSAEMKKLKVISESLAEIKLAGLIAEQNEAFKVGIKETVKLMDTARDKFALGQFFGKGKIGKEAINSFVGLNESIKALKLDPTAESIDKVESALLRVSKAGIDNTKQGRELRSNLESLIAEYKIGKISIDGMKDALKDSEIITGEVAKTTKKHTDEIKSMIDALNAQADAIGKTNREIALKTAVEKGATKAQKEAINASFDIIEAEEKRVAGLKLQIATQKELDRIMDLSFQNEQKRAKAEGAEKDKALGFAASVTASGMSPVEKLQAEQAQLLELKAKYVDDSAVFDEALTANANKQADLRAAYQVANANMILASSASLFGNIADLLKNSGSEQSAAYKAMFALSKGFAVAQAGLNLALAISNASAVTPWYASLAAVASVTSAGAGVIGAVSNAVYSGRENGGPVQAGQTYEVGEKNKPEMLMIPGNNGKVFSNAEMKSAMGGGGGVTMNQTINNGASVDGWQAQSRGDGITTPQVIDIVRAEMGDSNSYSRRSLATTSNVQNRHRSRR